MKQRKHIKRPTVLVLGGYGFIGRYTVAALERANARVLTGTRGSRENTDGTAERQVKLELAVTAKSWETVLRDVDVVINCVGILRERKNESFDTVHHKAVAALANYCAIHKIPLIHVSALGINKAVRNDFALSKLRGESAIQTSGCSGAIVRASVVDETDGYGSGWFHRLAQWPVWLMPAEAVKSLSPIKANDLGSALANLALRWFDNPKYKARVNILEVGCGETFTLESYLLRLRHADNLCGVKPLLVIRVPQKISKACAIVFDWLHITPYSIGHHELLEFDNLPVVNHLPCLLGRAPAPISAATRVTHGELIAKSRAST